MILHSHYERRVRSDDAIRTDDAGTGPDWYGTFTIDLVIDDFDSFPAGTRLAIWCATLLDPTAVSNARVVDRLAGHLVLEPLDREPIESTHRWTIDGLRSRFPARHANDGPARAFVILPTGATLDVTVIPVTTPPQPGSIRRRIPASPAASFASGGAVPVAGLVPQPAEVRVGSGAVRGRARLELARSVEGISGEALGAWNEVCELAGRLGVEAFTGARPAFGIRLDVDDSIDDDGHRIDIDDDGATIVASGRSGWRYGLTTLAQWADIDLPASARVVDHPAFPVRVVHLDVARQWYEPTVVERLIDLAAWRKFNRVHLHLTDDEAWRLPVAGYPELTDVGGTRGHGLPIGPLCASGAGPYGRAYTADEISRWVTRADAVGVTLVPEVDVPGHCHAALVALPRLRDPDDTSTSTSVQGYPNNVLVPGHPETIPFLHAVFGSLADLFPRSPWLHIGGDEVPSGAWSGSPIVAAHADERGLANQREIETAFHRDLIDMIRTTTGRDVAMWEEAALGGLEPSGYAVAWTSAAAGRRLAAAGHDVVMAPGQAYYLDMAGDRRWDAPGASWAGTVDLETTCQFDPLAGWDDNDRVGGRLLGVQACIWSEHITAVDVLDALVFPRLDAVAERGWTGRVVGGADSLAQRAALLPRFGGPGAGQ